jgi:GxxExxY protein
MALAGDYALTGIIIDAAIEVHRALGPSVLESAYEACLAYELRARGHSVRTQVALPLVYKGLHIEAGYRIDMLVGESVIVELKTVDKLLPIHEAQLLSYLKLSGMRVGLLINFRVPRLKLGIKRMLNGS